MENDEKWVSQSQAARLMGCSRQYIGILVKQGLRTDAKKQVLVSQARALLKNNGNGNGKVGPDYWLEKARHEKFKADLAQLELAKKNHEVVQIELVTEHLDRVFTAIRQKFLSLPTKLAPSIKAIDSVLSIRKVLETEVNEILNELCNYDPGK